jgi:SAM-dependent methyltransferase
MENQEAKLREKVHQAYSAAAHRPLDSHPFPVGRDFAESLGYPKALLESLPSTCIEAFSGVSNVAVFAEIPQGATVLDLGCGAGLDALVAAQRTGPQGKVIGVDFSEAMLARACRSASQAGIANVVFCRADAAQLPIGVESIGVALVNGIFNLNPEREAIFRELVRVVRRGGVVYSAELILSKPLPPEEKRSEANWFA